MGIIRKSKNAGKQQPNADTVPAKETDGPVKTGDAVLELAIDGQLHSVRQDDLLDADKLTELADKLRGANTIAIQNIAVLLAIPPGQRIGLMRLLAYLPDGARLVDGDEQTTDIFKAVVKMEVDSGDLQQAGLWQSLALMAAAIKYPGNLELACEEIRKRLKELGLGRPRLNALVRLARRTNAELGTDCDQSPDLPTVKAILPDAPVSDGLRIPSGWVVSEHGVSRVGADGAVVAWAPLILAGKSRHLQDGVECASLVFRRDGQWCRHTAERAVIANRNKLVELAAYGAPVTTNNAADLVEYLSAMEAENDAILPCESITGHMGWHSINGEDLFVSGEMVIRAETADDDDEQRDIDAPCTPVVRFEPSDAGNQQIVQAIRPRGEFSDWKSAIDLLTHYPRVLLAVFTSLAAPLLKILGVANFIVDYAAETSSGKTTSLGLGASVWGNPCESGPGGVSMISSWDSTPTFLERLAATLRGIVLIIDESKRAIRAAELLPRMIYAFVAGRGRGRGSVDGVRTSSTWATTMLSSGEQPLTSFTEDAGIRGRVIQIWGGPFGAANQQTAQLVDLLHEVTAVNYGHAGPHFVKWLLDHRGRWNDFRERFRELRADLMTHANNRPIAMRLSDSMAVICLAEELTHEALDLPTGNMLTLCAELLQQLTDTDRPADALRYLLDWARGNQGRFYRPGGPPNPTGGNEWVGRWDTAEGSWLGILPPKLKQALQEGGFSDFKGLVASWRDRGWLVLGAEGDGTTRTRFRTRIGTDNNARVIAIRQEAIEAVDPPGAAGDDEMAETDVSDDDLDGGGQEGDDPEDEAEEDEGYPDEEQDEADEDDAGESEN